MNDSEHQTKVKEYLQSHFLKFPHIIGTSKVICVQPKQVMDKRRASVQCKHPSEH